MTADLHKKAQPKRRWYQYSLRTLLIVVTLFAVACSWLAVKIRESKLQKEAVITIIQAGGIIHYDYQEKAPRTMSDFGMPPPGEPMWLRNALGEEFFDKPVRIWLSNIPKDESWIQAVNALPSVKYLILSGEYLSDKTLDKLAPSPNLEELSLSKGRISDRGLKNLSKFPNLRWLTINIPKITDRSFADMTPISLEDLILFDTKVSDESVPYIKAMKKLEMLDIRQTEITDSGVKDLQQALPKLKILQ